MSVILLSKTDEEYLEKCATQFNFTYGIIIGQRSEPEKYVIMHLAKNGEEDFDVATAYDDNNEYHDPQNVDEIDLQALTSQWSSAGRMIPGSFNVLGVFIAGLSKNYANDQSDAFKSVKRLLYNIHSLLKQNHQLIYTEKPQNEYLFISYSSLVKKAVCKIYNNVATGGTFSDIEHRFVEKPFEWLGVECNYEMDDVFPILENFEKLNLETHFQRTIDLMQTYLNCSEIFIQNEIVDDTDILGQYVKRYRRQQEGKTTEVTTGATVAETTDESATTTTAIIPCANDDYLKASILLPVKCLLSKYPNPIQVREFKGTIRFQGTVTSRIWCNPRNTISDVKGFLRTDIMRSLIARIQVYCDGLTDSMISNEIIFISEPPRRVYFNVNCNTGSGSGSGSSIAGSSSGSGSGCGTIPNSKSVQFSEYIFRGEAPTVVVAQAKQILDLDITTEHIVADLEGVLDDDAFNDDSYDLLETNKQRLSKTLERDHVRLELTRSMYMMGIIVALLILVISIGVHYIFQ